jgi:hypothetical protein
LGGRLIKQKGKGDKMTVEELIQELECLPREAEIRFASQPSWPKEYDVNGAVEVEGKVFLIEGEQLGYLDEEVRIEIGW